MGDKLDLLDVKIIEGLAKYGPRNVAEVARKLNVSRGTILSRIKRMSSLFYLRPLTNVYHTNIGLKKAVVFVRATPGYEELLFNCLKVNKFYIYLTRCYGAFEGCIGIYTVPKNRTAKFEQFIEEIKKLGVADHIRVFWSTCFHTVNRTSNWFDGLSETWVFPWDKWIKEVPAEETKLPYTLVDPKDFPVRADEVDLFIVKEMEKDATINLTVIAKKLGTTLQNVHYHYKRHVIKHELVEDFQIGILPFDGTISDMFSFAFKFDSWEKMAKFARSLLDKPFVFSVGKVLSKNAIIAQLYLPRPEFRNFVEHLSKLIRAGFLQTYEYVIQDLGPGKWSRKTIPYEFFKDGSWVYNHDGHVKELQNLVTQAESK
jgi:DNA-binding Lrp family transcriptional regulator